MFTLMRLLSTKEAVIAVAGVLPVAAALVAVLARERVRPWVPFLAWFAVAVLYFAALSGYSRGRWMFLGETICLYVLLGLILFVPALAVAIGVASEFSGRVKTALARSISPRSGAVGVGLYLAFVLAIFFLADFTMWGNRTFGARCLNNVRQIGLACIAYADDHGDRYPESFAALLKEGYITTVEAFFCPATFSRPPADFPADFRSAPADALKAIDDASDYVLVKGVPRADSSRILVYEKDAEHGDDRTIFFAEGHVAMVGEVEFRDTMAKRTSPAPSGTDNETPGPDNAPR